MKLATLLFFFILANSAFAAKCGPEVKAIESDSPSVIHLRTAKNHGQWTATEKKMIHKTVTRQEWLAKHSEAQAVEEFGDYYRGEIGSNAGEINYLKIGKKIIAQVIYWPGDNAYGAYVELAGTKVIVLAEIHDGDIYCP